MRETNGDYYDINFLRITRLAQRNLVFALLSVVTCLSSI
jgi:hypothetical protein